MKRTFIYLVVFLLIIMFAGCSYEQPVEIPNNSDSSVTERNYPMDDNGCVDIEYASNILEEKSKGNAPSEADSNLIDFYFLEGDKGMAVVDVHSIGMQKVVLKIYSTKDAGKTWQVVKDDFFVLSGYLDCIFYEDKLLFSNYASVTEKTSFFFVSIDGEETYMQEDFYEQHDFDDLRMQAKLDYLDEEEKIICLWYQDYDFEDIKHITFYDKNMSLRDCW